MNHLKTFLNRELGYKYLNYSFLNKIKYKEVYVLSSIDEEIIDFIKVDYKLFILTKNGICYYYNIYNNKLSFVNKNYEIIQSIFLNKYDNNLILLISENSDDYSSMTCYSLNLNTLTRTKIFDGEIKYPGFIEFEDEMKYVLINNSFLKYKIWDLKNYNLLFQLDNKNIVDIKLSPNLILVIYKTKKCNNPTKLVNIEPNSGKISKKYQKKIELYSIDTLQLIYSIKIPFGKTKFFDIDFIENLNDFLFIKYKNHNCIIYDLKKNKQITSIKKSNNIKLDSYLFIYHKMQFLYFDIKKNLILSDCNGNIIHNFRNILINQKNFEECYFFSDKQDLFAFVIKKKNNFIIRIINLINKNFFDINFPKNIDNVSYIYYDNIDNSIYASANNGLILLFTI